MEKLSTPTSPKQAKAHSRTRVEKFLMLGWTIAVELKAEDGETYEWLLNWPYDTEPVRPGFGEPSGSLP
jgi:hypothetical protein